MSALRKLAASRFLAFLLSFALVAGQAAATTILSSMPYSFSNGTASDATQVNANFQQIINQVNAGAAGSGSNNDITALNALTTPLTPAQGGTTVFLGGTSTGSANAQAVVIASPLTWSPAAGRFIAFTPGFTNTTATTLSVNAGTVTNLQKVGPAGLTALTGGEVVSGQQALVGFDGSSYILYNPANAAIGAATINMVKAFNEAKGASIAAAATTDIWTPADGNLYHITGLGGPITSFGTAPQAGAERTLIFDSTGVVLTYNATSLLLPSLANITTVAGDRAIVRADTTGNMIVVDYVRASGQSVAFAPLPNYSTIATTSGTVAPFAAIPSWAKRITIALSGVKMSGADQMQLQLGTGGGIVSSGYAGVSTVTTNGGNGSNNTTTTGFLLQADNSPSSANIFNGNITLLNITGTNQWVESGMLASVQRNGNYTSAGNVTLGAALTTVQLYTGAADTFTAGSATALFE